MQRLDVGHDLPSALIGKTRPRRHPAPQIAVGHESKQRLVVDRHDIRRAQCRRITRPGTVGPVTSGAVLAEEFLPRERSVRVGTGHGGALRHAGSGGEQKKNREFSH